MERRRGERKQLQQRINLESLHTGPVLVTMRDISLGGMFVETRSIFLSLNAAVVISFSLPRGETRYGFRMEAKVVRCTPTGAGLMFLWMEKDVIQILNNTLSRPSLSVSKVAWSRAEDPSLSPA